MDTLITMQGNLTADPKRYATANGAVVTRFRMVSSSRRFDKDVNEWVDHNPVYMTVACWRKLADNVWASLRKGDTVLVHGKVRFNEYDDAEGKRRSSVELEATSVGPDLSRYLVNLTRPARELEPVTAAAPADPVVPEQATNPWGETTEEPATTETAA